VTAPECLHREKFLRAASALAPTAYDQEYMCRFLSADDSIYAIDDLKHLRRTFPHPPGH
jgi:hypothetical protein